MSSWTMYWLVKLDDIVACSIAIAIIAGIASSVLLFAGLFNLDMSRVFPEMTESKKERAIADECFRVLRKIVPICLVCVALSVFVPSTKQMAAIMVTPAIVNSMAQNEELKELPNNVIELANDWIETLKPKETK